MKGASELDATGARKNPRVPPSRIDDYFASRTAK